MAEMSDGRDVPRFQPAADFELNFRSDRVRQIYEYWESKPDHGSLPSRADIEPLEVPRLLPYIGLVDVVEPGPPRLRYRLLGTHITQALGRDSTGLYFEDVYRGGMLTDLVETFERIIRLKKPIRYDGDASFGDEAYMSLEVVHMPLSSDGETVDMILIGALFLKSPEPEMEGPV